MAHNPHYIAAVAGAGTGKTYSLVENYISALFGFDGTGVKKRPQEILALTFTEKAAHEMRLRIIKKLSCLIARDSDDYDAVVTKACELDLEPPTSDEIKRILRALPNAPIATFHGFCSGLLRNYAHAIGIHDGFSIMSPKDELGYARNILRPILMAHIEQEDSLVRSLIARFRLSNGPMSLGLMDGLLALYGKLPEKGLDVEDFQLSNNDRRPTKADISKNIADIEQALVVFCSLKSSASTKSRLDEIRHRWAEHKLHFLGDDEYFIAKSYAELRQAIKGNFGDKEARASLVSAVVRLGANLVDYFLYADELTVATILVEFHNAFLAFKTKACLMSYADLLLKTKQALMEDLLLRRRIKKNIAHILVDEYQDTSPIQEDIIALLLENKAIESPMKRGARVLDHVDISGGPSLFVVGDKKQSIYGFRGADTTLFDHLMQKMSSSDRFSKRLLTINRRSSPKIIELVNLVAGATLGEQGYEREHDLQAFHHEQEGHAAVWIKKGSGHDKTATNLLGAAQGIAHLLLKRPDVEAKDIVVLVRRIKSASVIKDKLAGYGIPARIIGGEGFFQQQEVVDILSALKLVNDPGSKLASAVVLRSPLVLLSDQEILDIKLKMGAVSLINGALAFEQGLIEGAGAERLKIFLNALKKIRAIVPEAGISAAIDILIDDCKLPYALGLTENPHQAWANIKKLRVMAIKGIKNPFAAIDDLYAQITDNSREPVAESSVDNNAVTIMTIHQAKGLEFKVVVLADGESAMPTYRGDLLADQHGILIKPKNRMIAQCMPRGNDKVLAQTRFDQVRDDISNQEREEVARLLYVALTRAQRELYVVASHDSWMAKSDQSSLVGLFLQAFHQSKELFLSACDVVNIEDFVTARFHGIEKPAVEELMIFLEPPKKSRVFASSLAADEDLIKPWLRKDLRAPRSLVDGNLAHLLLASAGPMLLSNNNAHDDIVLDSVLRSLGVGNGEHVEATLAAVKTTLSLLKKSLPGDVEVIFEMPLSCWPTSDLLVEGFADMVLLAADSNYVMEFKSTLTAATAPKSYAQVLAYAHALSTQFDKPVKFSVQLVGAQQDIWWHSYDEHARDAFLSLIA
jgi:ATP-dependent helicase/nuclease subunit A